MKHRFKTGFAVAAVATALLVGWKVPLRGDGATGFSLIIQQGGSTKGAAVTMNCSTNVTCSLSGGVVTVTASGGGGGGTYQQSFTSQTSVILTHGLGSTQVVTQCFNGSNVEVVPDTTTITDANDVTVTFLNSQTGYCNVNVG